MKLLEMAVNESLFRGVSVNIRNLKFGISMDIEATILYDIEKVLAYGLVTIPENRDDKCFKKELLRTTVDIDKIFKGIATNFITKSIVNDWKANLNFEPKFPLKKVGNRSINSRNIKFSAIPGTYQMFQLEYHRSVLPSDFLERNFELAICRKDLGSQENDFFG